MDSLVIVSPGWCSSGSEWSIAPLRTKLEKMGYELMIHCNSDRGFGDIRQSAESLATRVVDQSPYWDDIYLMGHSMGGLVARYTEKILQNTGLVDGIITLCTPHIGVQGAHRAFWSQSAQQMVPGSELLNELNKHQHNSPVMNVAAKIDLILGQIENSMMQNADRTHVVWSSHLGVLFSGKVARLINQFVRDIQERKFETEWLIQNNGWAKIA